MPCGQPSKAASICPVWLESSSIACLPMMMRPGCSAAAMALRIFATASGSAVPSVFTRMPRSAPMASAVRMVSAACAGPIDTAMISVALPASFSRIASSTAISSKGFIDILTLESSTPEPSDLTLIFTSLSTARFTGTSIFMALSSVPVSHLQLPGRSVKRPHAAVRERTRARACGQRRQQGRRQPQDPCAAPVCRAIT